MNDLSNYFNSEMFYELIYRFKNVNSSLNLKDITSFLTSLNIELYLAVNDINLINEFNIELFANYSKTFCQQNLYDAEFRKNFNALLDKYVKIKLNTNDTLVIRQYLYNSIFKNDWKFHAFNSYFYDSIKSHGINPNINFTPQNEIDEINNIFMKYGIKNITGYQKINCEGKVSYSTIPDVSYSYGIRSPEWFSYFVAGGLAGDVAAFIEKDYSKALMTLKKIMDDRNFLESDRNVVISFFDKYWKMYVINSEPFLAIIKEPSDRSFAQFEYFTRQNKEMLGSCFNSFCINEQTDKKIDTTNALFIELPKYDKLIQYINNKENDSRITIDASFVPSKVKDSDGVFIFNVTCFDDMQKINFLNLFQKDVLNDFGENSKYFLTNNKCIKLEKDDDKLLTFSVPESLAFPLIKYLTNKKIAEISIANTILTETNRYEIYYNYLKESYQNVSYDNKFQK